MGNTIQSGIKSHTNNNLTNYALFLGGTNVINEVLRCYDPLKTGYGRLFMVRKPAFLLDPQTGIPQQFNKFKHIVEYGNTEITGLNDVSVEFGSITGGYVGKAFEIPTFAQDSTTTFTVTVYEFSGSPVREVLHTWINGTTDLMTGLSHYNGSSLEKLQANQTAEFIYCSTDVTGENIEYACLFANCFPGGLNIDVFNQQGAQHEVVTTQIDFHCTKYESIQINKMAKVLLDKYKIVANSLNFYSGFNASDFNEALHYDIKSGKMVSGMGNSSVLNRPQSINSWN